MPKYMIKANYTTEGVAGVVAKGGTARRDVIAKMVAGVGGTLECFYFAWGDTDAFVIVDLPRDEVMAAVALSVNKSGAAIVNTTPLLTCEQIDAAASSLPDYAPPGS